MPKLMKKKRVEQRIDRKKGGKPEAKT